VRKLLSLLRDLRDTKRDLQCHVYRFFGITPSKKLWSG